MSTFQKFPSIEQFRDCIRDVKDHTQYAGRDENRKPIYDTTKKLPIIEFHGTVKLHGTNAAVARRGQDEFWAQSRNRVLSLESDNAGFCAFTTQKKQAFQELFAKIDGVAADEIVTIFGEWCGQGIQKNVAIASLPKMFVVFAVKIGQDDNERWLSKDDVAKVVCLGSEIYNIYSFETFSITIDFNNPAASQELLEELTNRVEKQCPVGANLGVKGIGEGIVWTAHHNDKVYRFKVKGEEHAVSKAKHSAATAPEAQSSMDNFIKKVVTQQRCEQGVQELFTTQNKKLDWSETGNFLRWMQADIFKEETDTMIASNLSKEEVAKAINNSSRSWFTKYLKSTPAPSSSACSSTD